MHQTAVTKLRVNTAPEGWFGGRNGRFLYFFDFLKKSAQLTLFSYIFSEKVVESQWQRCNWVVTESVTEAKNRVFSYTWVTFSYNSVTFQLHLKTLVINGLVKFVTENRKKAQVAGNF